MDRLPDVALILVLPAVRPLASPEGETDATVGLELTHLTRDAMFVVELSEYVPMAVNCIDEPTGRSLGDTGVRVIELNDTPGVTTVSATPGLVTPEKDAVILVVPVARAVARPSGEMGAVSGLELDQITWDVRFVEEPSE